MCSIARKPCDMWGMLMKTLVLVLGVIFIVLTFIGAAYVIANHGNVSAGYAVIPMLGALICISYAMNHIWQKNIEKSKYNLIYRRNKYIISSEE